MIPPSSSSMQRVLRLPELGDACKVVGEHALEEVERAEAEDAELGHVADVEHARRARARRCAPR